MNWRAFWQRSCNAARRLRKSSTARHASRGNAAALWGHFQLFGGRGKETSVSAIIGTGLGGAQTMLATAVPKANARNKTVNLEENFCIKTPFRFRF